MGVETIMIVAAAAAVAGAATSAVGMLKKPKKPKVAAEPGLIKAQEDKRSYASLLSPTGGTGGGATGSPQTGKTTLGA